MMVRIALPLILLLQVVAGPAGAAVESPGNADQPAPSQQQKLHPTASGALQVQCWQHGRLIFEVSDLADLSLELPGSFNALSFNRPVSNGRAWIVNPNDTTCLIIERKDKP